MNVHHKAKRPRSMWVVLSLMVAAVMMPSSSSLASAWVFLPTKQSLAVTHRHPIRTRRAATPLRASLAVDHPEASTSTSASTASPTDDAENTMIQHRETFDRPSLLRGWTTMETQSCYELPDSFPLDLQGTFYQNGPGKFHVGDENVVHPFDGDGMVTAVTFKDGRAWFRNRFVETPGFLEELKTQKVCRRGVFGTAKNKGAWWSNILDIRTKNLANTHVMHWNERLFALWEGGKPFEIDPVTLETIDESDLDGSLPAGQAYAAHYKIDTQTKTVCNFAMAPQISGPNKAHTMTVMEHNVDMKLKYRKDHSLPRFGLSHDTAITDSYFIFAQSPVKFNVWPFVLGQKGVAQCITWDESAGKGYIHLVPRGGGGNVISIDIPPAFCFHTANSFEETYENGEIIITLDVVMADRMKMTEDLDEYPNSNIVKRFDFATELPRFQLTRYRLNVSTRKLLSETPLSDGCANVDFPVLNPALVGKPYRYAFCATSPSATTTMPVQGIAKIDVIQGRVLQKWLPKEHEYLSEVAFCPKTDASTEDDGYLVGYLMNGRDESTELVVFDARNVAQGPISSSTLRNILPHALHGTFVPGFTPELTDEVRESFARHA